MPSKVVFTTSREPSQRTRSFLKDIASLSPFFERLTRGKYTFQELVELARSSDARLLVVIGEMKGNPSIMRIYDVREPETKVIHTYTVFLKGVTLSREKGRAKPTSPARFFLDSPTAVNEQDRLTNVVLIELFNATPAKPERVEEGYIIVKVKPMWAGRDRIRQVEFIEGAKKVGPVIRIWGVKKVGKEHKI